LPGAGFAVFAVTAGVFVTAFYSFRMYFLVFHGKERFHNKPFPPEDDHAHAAHDDHAHDDHGHAAEHTPHESPWVVTLPLVLLAIPSVIIGFLTIQPMLFGNFFDGAIVNDIAQHPAMEELKTHFHSAGAMAAHAFQTVPFWFAAAGVAVAAWFYLLQPAIPAALGRIFSPIVRILENKYYLDWFNEHVLAAGARMLGTGLWKGGDQGLIDGVVINGSAGLIGRLAGVVRQAQTGHLYQYALVMLLGIFGLMTWMLWPFFSSLMR
jgi:NADH-quinone oxidoreductase subunit L